MRKFITDVEESRDVYKRPVAIFPEGTRTPEQALLPFKGGTKLIAEKLGRLLYAGMRAKSSNNHDALAALIHVKDNKDVPVFNELWNEWLPEGCAPARSCVQSTMARDVVLVEVTIIAAL